MKTAILLLLAVGLAAQEIPVGTLPMSAAVTPDKKTLLVLNCGVQPPSISVIDVATAKETSRVAVPDAWLGMAMTKAGDKVYVGGGARGAVYEFTVAGGAVKAGRVFAIDPLDFIGDVQFSPDGRTLYAASLNRDAVVTINPQSGLLLSRIKTGRRPYRILFHPSGKSFYVTSWTEGTIARFDVSNGKQLASVRVGPHPTDMVWRDGTIEDHPEVSARLFVSLGNTNNLYAYGANEVGDLTRLETINLSLGAAQPLGTTPTGLSLTADGRTLFVACAGIHAVAVLDVGSGQSVVRGLLPAGDFPTAAVGLPDGRVAMLSSAGTVRFAKADEDHGLEVLARTGFTEEKLADPGTPAGNPIRANGPIQHVVYVVKSAGKAGPKLSSTLDKLALKNCGANTDSSEVGLLEAVAGMASDYARRLAPANDAGRRTRNDFEWQEPANSPPAGYLWDSAAQLGITMRNYGFFVENLAKPTADGTHVGVVHDQALAKDTDMEYRGLDKSYPDADRAAEFNSELADYGEMGTWPQLLLVRLGDSDEAVGAIVDAVAKSKFWKDTAIFIVADAGSAAGPGCFVASPWAKGLASDNTKYDQSSALRTIEIILGVHPMTIQDAGATPMFSVFDQK